jgi:hypothetical protein
MAGTKAKSKKPAGKKIKPKQKMSGTCMVLMPFKEPFDTYFLSIIKPAVNAAKLESIRGDSLFRPSPIMADIWQMIQDAKVLVADLTEKNANVFYELGLAHALGKPVVLLADNLADVPFDLQSLRVIIYDKNDPAWGAELKTRITESLKETLGDAASAVPAMFRKVVKSQAPVETRTEYRLDMLERQVASLAAGAKGLSPRLRSPSELFRRLKDVSSRSEVVDITRAALLSGMPQRLLRRVIRDAISSRSEVNAIFRELGLAMST